MLTLPEHLLLIALHDDKGTVHPAAYLALDTCLRGALLAELRLQGRLQTTASDEVRRVDDRWTPTGFPVVDDAMVALNAAPSPAPVSAWLSLLEQALPDVRARVVTLLQRRQILERTDAERGLLGESAAHPMTDGSQEEQMRSRLADTVDAEPDYTSPRLGTLLALTDAANLLGAALDLDHRGAAADRAAWVASRDAVVRAVREAVARAEGTWS